MEGRDKNVTKRPEGGMMKARGGEREVVKEEGRKPSASPDDFQTPPSSPPLKRQEEEQNMEVDESGQKWWSGSFSEEDQHWGQPQSSAAASYGKKIKIPKLRSSWSSRDTVLYRERYPGKRDDPRMVANYQFYTNKIPSQPDGDLIDNIHQNWWGNYYLLEAHHGYIQWLFPIRESGMNFYSEELQLHEIEKICADPEAHKRVRLSYEMMLDFYGMKLKNLPTGELERADNWRERFRHLNYSMHNYLRITRILKCLGELGFEHYKAPFVRFVLQEAIVERTLIRTLDSCMNYWVEVIRDKDLRTSVRTWAEKLAEES